MNHKGTNDIKWISPLLNIIQTDQEIWKVWAKVHLHPDIKYDYHCASFHETHAC